MTDKEVKKPRRVMEHDVTEELHWEDEECDNCRPVALEILPSSEQATNVVFSQREHEVLLELSKKLDISPGAVLRQGLRVQQLISGGLYELREINPMLKMATEDQVSTAVGNPPELKEFAASQTEGLRAENVRLSLELSQLKVRGRINEEKQGENVGHVMGLRLDSKGMNPQETFEWLRKRVYEELEPALSQALEDKKAAEDYSGINLLRSRLEEAERSLAGMCQRAGNAESAYKEVRAAWQDAESAAEKAEAERDHYKKYANHLSWCESHDKDFSGDYKNCTCGLEELEKK
jgi:hypothetical protein